LALGTRREKVLLWVKYVLAIRDPACWCLESLHKPRRKKEGLRVKTPGNLAEEKKPTLIFTKRTGKVAVGNCRKRIQRPWGKPA